MDAEDDVGWLVDDVMFRGGGGGVISPSIVVADGRTPRRATRNL